jgi:serine/threonine protein kinase
LPPDADLRFIDNEEILIEISNMQVSAPPPFSSLFPPGTNPQALDIMSRMMIFNPDDRISVEDALAHPYLKDFHRQMSAPSCNRLFDFDFEKRAESEGTLYGGMTDAEVRHCMFEEVCKYRPCAEGKGFSTAGSLTGVLTRAPVGKGAKGEGKAVGADDKAGAKGDAKGDDK